jgi:aminopeptidase N
MALRRPIRMLPIGAAAVSVVLFAPAASAGGSHGSAGHFTPGAPGGGDGYFPLEGNGGYDVQHYGLDLSYAPDTDRLDGSVVISARAGQNLSRFDLDLQNLPASSVTVNGRRASFTQSGQELQITPQSGLRKGGVFVATVRYGGVPKTIVGSPIVFGSPYGFLHTPDGAFVGAEPNAASTWYPSNDHPSDKASFTIRITVPKGLGAVSNGILVSERTKGDKTTFVWNQRQPMATYLATMDIGNWEVKQSTTPGGVPNYVAVDPVLLQSQPDALNFFTDTTAQVTDLWSNLYGKYPFDTAGAIADDARYEGQPLGFSLETQSKPVYSAVRDTTTIAHEMAHQWFGDSVSPARWKDIWLNESFATWSHYYWNEKQGGRTVYDQARAVYNARPFPDAAGRPYWSVVVADPQRDTMFNDRVYSGGAMVLQFLREKIGDEAFFKLLRTWYADHKYGNATTEQFTALAKKITGQDLDGFFQTWLYTPGKHPLP